MRGYFGPAFYDWRVPLPGFFSGFFNALRGGAVAAADLAGSDAGATAAAIWPRMGADISLVHANVLFFGVTGLSTIAGNAYRVVVACRRQATDPNAPKHIGSGTKITIVGAVFHGLFPWCLVIATMWVLFGDVVPDGFLQEPRTFLWAFAFVFQHMVSRCMVAHLCEAPFAPWLDALVPAAVVAARCHDKLSEF